MIPRVTLAGVASRGIQRETQESMTINTQGTNTLRIWCEMSLPRRNFNLNDEYSFSVVEVKRKRRQKKIKENVDFVWRRLFDIFYSFLKKKIEN